MKFGGTSVADADAIDRVARHRAASSRRQRERGSRRSSSCRRCRGHRPADRDRAAGARTATADRRPRRSWRLLERHLAVAAGARRAEPRAARWPRRCGASSTSSTASCTRSRCCARCRRARSTRRRRWASWPAAASSRRRSPTRASRPCGSTRARCSSPTPSTRRPLPDMDATVRARRASSSRPARARGEVAVLGGFIGATARRRHDDARPRRLGLFGGDLRRVPRRRRDPDLDRRRRHADRRSAHRAAAARRAAAVVRRSVGAGVLRREGAAPEHDSAGRREEHSGAHPELAAAGESRARSSRPTAAATAAADGARVQARRDGRRHHVDAHADGARLSAPRCSRCSSASRPPVDVVTTSEVSVSVTVDDTRRLDDDRRQPAAISPTSACEPDMAIVCAVGENLRDGSDAVRPGGDGARARPAAAGVAGRVAAEHHVRAARRRRPARDDAAARGVLLDEQIEA